MPHQLTIIIVNWNGKHLLSECLTSIRRQHFKSFTTILVDNGSTDGSVKFVQEQYPEVKMVALSKNMGFATANNIAIRQSNTQYVALLNNDAVADPMWASHLVGAIESYPEAGFAASKILFYHHPQMIDRAGDGYSIAGAGILRGRNKPAAAYNQKEWIFGACAAAALYKKRMLDDIGLFDEDFFLLYEDVDLSFRAQLKGYKCLYVPEAVVYHRASSSIIHDSPVSIYYGHRNLEWTYFKNMPNRLILKTILFHAIYNAAAGLFFLSTGKIKDWLRAKADAFRNFKSILAKRQGIQREKRVDDQDIQHLLEWEWLWQRMRLRR